jgi:DnaJ-class molecular chaperone
MAKSYYETLGLKRDASQKEIKAAYRRLARKHHPDVNPGDRSAEGRFKEINRAFEVLSDADKRAKYDRYGESWEQAEAFEKARAAHGGRGSQTFTFDINDLLQRQGRGGGGGFEEILGGIFGGMGRRGPARGQNVEYAAGITLEEAYHGTTRTLHLESQEACATCAGRGEIAGAVCHACEGAGAVLHPKRIEVKIPAGAKDGTRVRIAGEGSPSLGRTGPRGDLYVVVKVRPHARFERRGDDLVEEISVPVEDAVLGGEAHVLTIAGKRIAVTIPPLTQNGRAIRLAGLGMPKLESRAGHGDLLVKVRLVIPEKLTDEERALFERLRAIRNVEKTGAKA